ncbi:MAG: MBL fold metallo-hydrolase [Solirubrobacteraceae bacterium]
MTRLEVPGHPITGLRADNPGPFTLTGTNSWIVGAHPAWLVDPGPAVDAHLAAVIDELERRGGLGGVALTHDHPDHVDALPSIRGRFPLAPIAAARGAVDRRLGDGHQFGPLTVVSTPGHAEDHLAYVVGTAALTGDAVLGAGSSILSPDPGALTAYLDGLARLGAMPLTILLPGHGPIVGDPGAKLAEYTAHRLDRERRLVVALDAGARSMAEMLDAAWGDVPEAMRPAAAVSLAAHLDKLDGEGRLPAGVQRCRRPGGDVTSTPDDL